MPTDPHLLVLGYPKCGNVWLRALLADLILASGVNFRQVMEHHPGAAFFEQLDLGIKEQAHQDQVFFEPLRVFQCIPDVFRWAIPDLGEYVRQTSMVHSHSEWSPLIDRWVRVFDHHILIVRDPRDVAISWAQWMFTPFNLLHRPSLFENPAALLHEDFPFRMRSWDQYHRNWRAAATGGLKLHVVFYERLVHDTIGELALMRDYLGLETSDRALAGVAARHALAPMKQRQPNHVFRGRWGGWVGDLHDRQVRLAENLCGELLNHLGYPLNRRDAEDWTPARLVWSVGT